MPYSLHASEPHPTHALILLAFQVHTLTPVPYVFKPLEKIAVGHAS